MKRWTLKRRGLKAGDPVRHKVNGRGGLRPVSFALEQSLGVFGPLWSRVSAPCSTDFLLYPVLDQLKERTEAGQ